MDLFKVRSLLSEGMSIYDIDLRVTFYSRVSTEHEEQISSLNNQVGFFKDMIKSNKKWTYIPGYVDHGISGTIDIKRDNFMNMIRDAKKGLFDLIITKEISRFSRNTLDSIKYTRELLNYGVSVYFLNDNINTSLLDSELRLTIMASLAQDEVRRLSERVKFGMKRSIKNGRILGNDLLYGYRKNKVNNSLVINNEEAEVVKRLFTLYAISKKSLHSIANTFNNEGMKTSLNKKWNVTTLSRMIRNPKYKGFYCGGKSEVVDYMSKKVERFDSSKWIMYEDKEHIPPIVPEYLFDLANKRLNEAKLQEHRIIKYPLSSKIICSLCRRCLHKRRMSKNKDEVVWFCTCCKINIRESEINYVIKNIFNIDYNNIESNLLNNYKSIGFIKSFDSIKKEIDDINKRQEKLFELAMDDCISNKEFKDKNDYYNELLDKLNSKLNEDDNNELIVISDFINEYFGSNAFIEDLINLSIVNIYTKYIDNETVELNIKTNVDNMKKCKVYNFKRGYDVIGTRRYIFNVIVYIN